MERSYTSLEFYQPFQESWLKAPEDFLDPQAFYSNQWLMDPVCYLKSKQFPHDKKKKGRRIRQDLAAEILHNPKI